MNTPSHVHRLVLTAALALALPSFSGQGAEASGTNALARAELEPVTVSARGRGVNPDLLPGSVDIAVPDNSGGGAVGAAGIAATIPGVSVDSDGPWTSDVNIRGLARDSVVMTIDDCRVNTATDLGARFALMDPAAIESVEVLKGPISSLYGSGSIGGAVNVRTRSGHFSELPDWAAGLSAGWDSASSGFDGYAFGEYDGPRCHLYAGQAARDHGDYTAGDGEEVRNSGFRDRQTLFRAGWQCAPHWTIEAGLQLVEASEVGVPGSGTAPLPESADVTYQRASRALAMASVAFEPAGGALENSRLLVYDQEIERRVRIDNFPSASPLEEVRPQADHATRGVRWLNTISPGAGHTIAAGADAWDWSLTSSRSRLFRNGNLLFDEPLPDASYLSAGAFAEDDWQIGRRAIVNAGGRLDAIDVSNEANDTWEKRSESETAWSLHGGTSIEIARGLRAKCVVASGYRAATLSERYQYLELGGGVRKFGNPDLEPERSLLTEAGLVWASGPARAEIAVFRDALDNLIAEKREDAVTFRNENIAEAEIVGAEAQAVVRAPPGIEAFCRLAWATGRNTQTDEFLPGISPLSGSAGVTARASSGWWAEAVARFAAAQYETPDGVDNAPAWMVADVRAGRSFRAAGAEHRIYAGVDNVADAEYREYLTTSRGAEFKAPGRSLVLGYQAEFR